MKANQSHARTTPGTQLLYYMTMIIITEYDAFQSICFNVGNSCSPSNKDSKNVIIRRKYYFLQAYNCIKEPNYKSFSIHVP